MRDNTKAFCRLAAERIDCPGPVHEFGSYQTLGQQDYADLRPFFRGLDFVGCDARPGPGVDRVEDVSRLTHDSESVGTALAIETFEHVFEIAEAFNEVHRVLRPGGVFVVTLPLNFRIHDFPDDFWRMTPACLRRMMARYATRITCAQGSSRFPHSIFAIGIKAPAPADAACRLEALGRAFAAELRASEAALPAGTKLLRKARSLYRSKVERREIRDHYHLEFAVEQENFAQSPRLDLSSNPSSPKRYIISGRARTSSGVGGS